MKIINLPLVLAFMVLIVLSIYYPGLKGGFIFDDMVNFQQIKYFTNENGIIGWFNYIISNPSGMLKRPISMLSFLINSNVVPKEAYYFKLTNVILHIVNAFLLFVLIQLILKLVYNKSKWLVYTAIFATLMWALHPYFVSTVLYSVQRMAILTTTFVIYGMILYSKGRLLIEAKNKKGKYYLVGAVYIFTLLATLSKENGVLLPFYVFLLEVVIFKKYFISQLSVRMKSLLFYLPMSIVLLSLIYKYPDFILRYASRDFNLIERMLTETRVLVYYLYNLFVPIYFTEGVFADVFTVSKGIFKPISTFYSIVFLISLLTVSFAIRKQYPIIVFGILFYFMANIIESTIIPLEIYFEHRAYLTTMFIPLMVTIPLLNLIKNRKLLYIIPISILLYLSFCTYLKSNLWSNNFVLITQSAKKYPYSIRAINHAAIEYSSIGLNSLAKEALFSGTNYNQSIGLEANLYTLECQLSKFGIESSKIFKKSLINYKIKESDLVPFINFIKYLIDSNCIEFNLDLATEFLKIYKNKTIHNNQYVHSRIELYQLIVSIEKRNFESVAENLQKVIDTSNDLFIYEELFNIIDRLVKYNQVYNAGEALNLISNSMKNNKNGIYYFMIKDEVEKYNQSLQQDL